MPAARIEEAARFARERGMGVEIECDGRFLESAEYRMKYKAYLDGGVTDGYMRRAVCGYSALLAAYRSKDPAIHALYDRTCEFVKGIYDLARFPKG